MAISAFLATLVGSWFALSFSACLAELLMCMLPVVLLKEFTSMRDYELKCTAWNYGELAKVGGARAGRGDVWRALVVVAQWCSGTGFTGVINREKRFR